jgi:hypothetical protein
VARVVIPPEVFAKIVGEAARIQENRNNVVNITAPMQMWAHDRARLAVAIAELSLHIKHLRDLLMIISEENHVEDVEVPNGC